MARPPLKEGTRVPDFDGTLYKIYGGKYGEIRLWWTVAPGKPHAPYLSGTFRIMEHEVRMILYPKTSYTTITPEGIEVARQNAEKVLARRGKKEVGLPETEEPDELDEA